MDKLRKPEAAYPLTVNSLSTRLRVSLKPIRKPIVDDWWLDLDEITKAMILPCCAFVKLCAPISFQQPSKAVDVKYPHLRGKAT